MASKKRGSNPKMEREVGLNKTQKSIRGSNRRETERLESLLSANKDFKSKENIKIKDFLRKCISDNKGIDEKFKSKISALLGRRNDDIKLHLNDRYRCYDGFMTEFIEEAHIDNSQLLNIFQELLCVESKIIEEFGNGLLQLEKEGEEIALSQMEIDELYKREFKFKRLRARTASTKRQNISMLDIRDNSINAKSHLIDDQMLNRASSLGTIKKRMKSFYDRELFKQKQQEAEEFIQRMQAKKERLRIYKVLHMTDEEKKEQEQKDKEMIEEWRKKREEKEKQKQKILHTKFLKLREKQHERYLNKYGAYTDKADLEAKEAQWNKLHGGEIPIYKKLEKSFNRREEITQLKVNKALHDKYRRIDFESIKEHERKIKQIVKQQKEKRDEFSRKIHTSAEHKDSSKMPPMLNVYEQQIKELKDKIKKRNDFAKIVHEQNMKPKDPNDEDEEGAADEDEEDNNDKAVNDYMKRKLKDEEIKKRIEKNQIENERVGYDYLKELSNIKKDLSPKKRASKAKLRPLVTQDADKEKKKFMSTQEFDKRKKEAKTFLKSMKQKYHLEERHKDFSKLTNGLENDRKIVEIEKLERKARMKESLIRAQKGDSRQESQSNIRKNRKNIQGLTYEKKGDEKELLEDKKLQVLEKELKEEEDVDNMYFTAINAKLNLLESIK